MQSQYVPDIHVDNFDQNHVNNQEWKDAEAVKESETQLRRDSVQELFKGYYYNKHDFSMQPEPSSGVGGTTVASTGNQITTTKARDTVENELASPGSARKHSKHRRSLNVDDEIQEENV